MSSVRWSKSQTLEQTTAGTAVVAAAGAKAFFYDANTTTPQTVYQDDALTTPHTQPVVASSQGRWPDVFLNYGSFAETVTTSTGSQLYSTSSITIEQPTDPSDSVDANALLTTGDVWWSPVDGTRAGAVRCNGRSIGSANSSATERANADTKPLYEFLWPNYPVAGGKGSTAESDFNLNKELTLPDIRAGQPYGLDDMGNTAAGRFASAPFASGDATTPGSTVGSNTQVIAEANLPAHSHASGTLTVDSSGAHSHTVTGITVGAEGAHIHSGTTNNESVAHVHALGTNVATSNGTAGVDAGSGISVVNSITYTALSTGFNNVNHTHSFTTGGGSAHTHALSGSVDSSGSEHTHSISGSTAQTGSGTALNIVSHGETGTWYIKL